MDVTPAVFPIGNNNLTEKIEYTKKMRTAVLDENGNTMWRSVGTIPSNMMRQQELAKNAVEMIKEGKSVLEILTYDPSSINRVFQLERVHQLMRVPEPRPGLQVYLLYGKTGVGKTYTIMNMLEPGIYNKPHPKPGQTDFWMGYAGEEAVLFDDFHPSRYSMLDLLNYLQEYAMRVPVKGGHYPALWKRVYISTNVPIEQWYKSRQNDPEYAENYKALLRRIPPENRLTFVKRLPPDMHITTFAELKKFQDSALMEEECRQQINAFNSVTRSVPVSTTAADGSNGKLTLDQWIDLQFAHLKSTMQNNEQQSQQSHGAGGGESHDSGNNDDIGVQHLDDLLCDYDDATNI